MSNTIITYELTDFDLRDDERIVLGGASGMIKIMRSIDGKLILMTDGDFGLIDQDKPTPRNVHSADDMLGFILDIGIRREKKLTYSNGLYLGQKLIEGQSHKPIDKNCFDPDLMNRLESKLNTLYQSGDVKQVVEAIRLSHLIKAFNHARLLYPDFIDESYLGLMRILDSLSNDRRPSAIKFALKVAGISTELNKDIFDKIFAVEGMTFKAELAERVFEDCQNSEEGRQEMKDTTNLSTADKFIFSSFYSAYRYRSKSVHINIPFPHFVKEALFSEQDSGMAYSHPAQGESYIKVYRPDGLLDGDLVDIHCVIENEDEAKKFKECYFKLLPTWHFVKCITRQGIMNAFDV